MDFRDLLRRYVQHVGECEGSTFLMYLNDSLCGSSVVFSAEEVKVLLELDKESK